MLKKRHIITVFTVIVFSFFSSSHIWADNSSDPGPGSIPSGNSDPGQEIPAVPGWAGNLVYDSSNNTWLVVSQTADNKNIYGQILSNEGKLIGKTFTIASGGEILRPRAAYAPDANKFLVIWISSTSNTTGIIYGQFVSGDGQLMGSKIKIDEGSFLLPDNTVPQYDPTNKRFVFVLENRANGVEVTFESISVSGQPGERVQITNLTADGVFNAAPSVAVNPTDGQYCVMYQHVDDPKANTGSRVMVVPVTASSLSMGEKSSLTDDMFFLYNIVYNPTENAYFGMWSNYGISELDGKSFADCKNDPDQEIINIGDKRHNGTLAYNPTSDAYAAVVEDADSSDDYLYVFDSAGDQISSGVVFTGASKGNYMPRVAANTSTGMFAGTTSQDYATTKFSTNLGGPDLLSRSAKAIPPITAVTTLPVPNDGLPTNLGQLIQAIFNWSFSIIGLVIFVRFFYAGFLWFTNNGNSQRISQARTIMWNAIYGAALLFSSYLILNTINPDFVKGTLTLPGLSGVTSTSSGGGGTIPPPDKSPSYLYIVTTWRAKYPANMTGAQIVEMLKGIATDINKTNDPEKPFGILQKPGDPKCNNYSCDIICSGQGDQQRQYDVLGDSDPGTGKQTPSWSFVSPIAIRQCEIQP